MTTPQRPESRGLHPPWFAALWFWLVAGSAMLFAWAAVLMIRGAGNPDIATSGYFTATWVTALGLPFLAGGVVLRARERIG